MSAAVEPWVEPYLPDFTTIRQILARTPGFLLQPIETPSPDLARALAHWLAQKGAPNTIVELAGPRDWDQLQQALVRPSGEARPTTIVVATRTPSESEARRPLSLLNMARDSLAPTAGHILWCGDTEFQQLTRRLAPDLWSVAGSPYSIPLRRLHDVPPHWPGRMNWWTGAVDEDLAELRRRAEATAVEPDPSARLGDGLKLAEALLAHKDIVGAREKLDQLESEIRRHTPLLVPRWNELSIAAIAASEPEAEKTLQQLHDDLESARARGAVQVEALIHVRLAILYESLQRAEAFDEFLKARALWALLGDRAQVLEIDTHLTLDYALSFDLELREAIFEDASSALDSEDPETAARGELILAKLALMDDRLAEAERHAERASHRARGTGVEVLQIPALQLQAVSMTRRGEFHAALELAGRAQALSEKAERPFLELQARSLIADILEEQGRPLDAAKELLAIFAVLNKIEDDFLNSVLFLRIARCAHAVGDDAVASWLCLVGVYCVLPNPQTLVLMLESGSRLRELLAALPTAERAISPVLALYQDNAEPEQLRREIAALTVEEETLAKKLSERGVEPFDPDTWANSAP